MISHTQLNRIVCYSTYQVAEIKAFKDPKRHVLQPSGSIRSLTPQLGVSSSQQATTVPEVIDPRELDINLNEMVLISQRSHLYNRFLESRAKVCFFKHTQSMQAFQGLDEANPRCSYTSYPLMISPRSNTLRTKIKLRAQQ